jgi:hypothetical protein
MVELDHVQSGQEALHCANRLRVGARQQAAAGGFEIEQMRLHRHIVGIGAAQLHITILITGVVDAHLRNRSAARLPGLGTLISAARFFVEGF